MVPIQVAVVICGVVILIWLATRSNSNTQTSYHETGQKREDHKGDNGPLFLKEVFLLLTNNFGSYEDSRTRLKEINWVLKKTHTHIDTDPRSAQFGLNVEFVMKIDKLQYAIKYNQ